MKERLLIFKNKDIMRNIFTLAWPTVIQEALSVCVQYADTAMVGMIGASASAAVGLTGSVNWLIGSVCIAFGIGILAVVAKSMGAKNIEKARKASVQAIYITLFIGMIVGIIAYVCSYYLPTWLGADPSIHKEASSYFRIVSLPMVFKASTLIFGSVLRGAGDSKTPMLVNVLMNLINIILNFILIYPTRDIMGISVYGANLGVNGAAMATAISLVIGGVLMAIVFFKNKQLEISKQDLHFHFNDMRESIKIGVPICMERIVICFGHIFFASLVSKLGVLSLAAHSIALTAEQAFYIPGYGMQAAASTLIGNALGEREEKKVKDITFAITFMTFIIMTFLAILLFIFASQVMKLFTTDPEVIALGSSILRIVSLSEPLFGILVILEGVFNGMGDTKAPFIYSCITMWGIRILGAICMIQVFHFGIEAVWVMMVLDNVARCLLLGRRFILGKWKYRL
ncbi:MAG: MATE family efflux transporter [Coprobacillaceae bacterium]